VDAEAAFRASTETIAAVAGKKHRSSGADAAFRAPTESGCQQGSATGAVDVEAAFRASTETAVDAADVPEPPVQYSRTQAQEYIKDVGHE
jgi:hypothetical protein